MNLPELDELIAKRQRINDLEELIADMKKGKIYLYKIIYFMGLEEFREKIEREGEAIARAEIDRLKEEITNWPQPIFRGKVIETY